MARANDADEIAKAGYLLAELLASTLYPASGTWDGVRAPYIWEHNALCWLHRNRARIPSMSAWTALILDDGYPFKPYTDWRGTERPAGYLWDATMKPRK